MATRSRKPTCAGRCTPSRVCDGGHEIFFMKNRAIVVPEGSLAKFLDECQHLVTYEREDGLYVVEVEVRAVTDENMSSCSSVGCEQVAIRQPALDNRKTEHYPNVVKEVSFVLATEGEAKDGVDDETEDVDIREEGEDEPLVVFTSPVQPTAAEVEEHRVSRTSHSADGAESA